MGRAGCGCSGGSAALFISELVMLAMRWSGLAAEASSSEAVEAAAAECMNRPAGWRPERGPGPGPGPGPPELGG